MSDLPPDLPTVSIVTPSYNHAKYIEATVRSVLEQQYPKLEYLVVDGASTDETAVILEQLAGLPASAGSVQDNPLKRADRADVSQAPFTWISEPDAGQSDAIGKGFARTTGEIIGWLNSDDCYKPGAILAAATYLRDHPDVALVYGDAEFIRPDGRFLAKCANTEPFSRHRLLHYSDYIVQPAAFWRRSAFDSVGGLDASLHYAMDYDLWLKLAAKYEFAYVPETWAQYRWLGENKSATGNWKRIEEIRQVARRAGAKRLPAYFRLEAVNLHLQAAKQAWPTSKSIAIVEIAKAIANAAGSPRAWWSLCQPHTWRIIRTGRILRGV